MRAYSARGSAARARTSMDPLIQILKRLNEQGLDFVLIDGMAAIAHGSPMMTRDGRDKDLIGIRHLEAIKKARGGGAS